MNDLMNQTEPSPQNESQPKARTVYTRILNGETLEVQFKVQCEGLHAGPFEVRPLWMIGNFYVTESSEWKPFARVGGIVIDGRRRVQMECEDLQSWCDELEEVHAQR